ncbi:MAG: radical SAM family heme chaperone HemW [Solobacterium sp.]|nr:radical SAM family heme chaperone HemW [Solobacterium sp.]
MNRNNRPPESLYLHVPFCRSVCAYCDFTHTVYRRENAGRWLDALTEEIRMRKIDPALKTVYIGGGTPTCLEHSQLERLLELLDPYVSGVQEYTAEINPETLDEEKAALLKAHGVNRASIGFQSHDPGLLRLMGRKHSAEDVRSCMDLLRDHGIRNISLDLMYSLPGQTMEILQESVRTALSFEPDHLSLYSLTIEENTVFGRKGYAPLDEETEADMYEWICRYLAEQGFEQYEISNFAREGKKSQHNLAYWHYDDFYGISCGASGKENGIRYDITKNLKEYLEEPGRRETVTELSERDQMMETLMMGLRLKEGISLDVFRERFGITFSEAYGEAEQSLTAKGLIECRDGSLRCTPRGYAILNSVLVEFLD